MNDEVTLSDVTSTNDGTNLQGIGGGLAPLVLVRWFAVLAVDSLT
jgi:hypothetical protein